MKRTVIVEATIVTSVQYTIETDLTDDELEEMSWEGFINSDDIEITNEYYETDSQHALPEDDAIYVIT